MTRFKYPPGTIVEFHDSPVKDGYQPFMIAGHVRLEDGDFYQLRELCDDGSTFLIGTLARREELTTHD